MSAPILVDKIKRQFILSVNSENSDLYFAALNMLLEDFVRTKDEFVLRLKLYDEIYLVALYEEMYLVALVASHTSRRKYNRLKLWDNIDVQGRV